MREAEPPLQVADDPSNSTSMLGAPTFPQAAPVVGWYPPPPPFGVSEVFSAPPGWLPPPPPLPPGGLIPSPPFIDPALYGAPALSFSFPAVTAAVAPGSEAPTPSAGPALPDASAAPRKRHRWSEPLPHAMGPVGLENVAAVLAAATLSAGGLDPTAGLGVHAAQPAPMSHAEEDAAYAELQLAAAVALIESKRNRWSGGLEAMDAAQLAAGGPPSGLVGGPSITTAGRSRAPTFITHLPGGLSAPPSGGVPAAILAANADAAALVLEKAAMSGEMSQMQMPPLPPELIALKDRDRERKVGRGSQGRGPASTQLSSAYFGICVVFAALLISLVRSRQKQSTPQ